MPSVIGERADADYVQGFRLAVAMYDTQSVYDPTSGSIVRVNGQEAETAGHELLFG